jgi:hypothetical protein
VTIFHSLRFETSLFVASYDSQGHGGGIGPRLQPSQSQSQSQSYIATDGRSISKSWCRAPSGARDQIFIIVWQLRSCFGGAPCLTRGRFCLLYMLLVHASAFFLGSESLGSRDHILLSGTDRIENTTSNYFYIIASRVLYRGNLFYQPPPSNVSFLWHNYSAFQLSCHRKNRSYNYFHAIYSPWVLPKTKQRELKKRIIKCL